MCQVQITKIKEVLMWVLDFITENTTFSLGIDKFRNLVLTRMVIINCFSLFVTDGISLF